MYHKIFAFLTLLCKNSFFFFKENTLKFRMFSNLNALLSETFTEYSAFVIFRYSYSDIKKSHNHHFFIEAKKISENNMKFVHFMSNFKK